MIFENKSGKALPVQDIDQQECIIMLNIKLIIDSIMERLNIIELKIKELEAKLK